jgi:predicted metal-dependent hydrolase
MLKETIIINNQTYIVKIYFEKRRNSTCSISKNINIRIPIFISKEQQTKNILKLKAWAIQQLEKNPKLINNNLKKPTKQYSSGDVVIVNDQKYILNIISKNNKLSTGFLQDNQIILNISSKLSNQNQQTTIKNLLYKLFSQKEQPYLENIINNLNNKYFQEKINNITFKKQFSRWGSCSRQKNINISTRLLFAPKEVLEYVCLHELAHLKELNHSPRYWKIVKNIDSNYKLKEKWLKENKYIGF